MGCRDYLNENVGIYEVLLASPLSLLNSAASLLAFI